GALFLPVGHYTAPAGEPPAGLAVLALVTVACAAVGFVFTRLRVPAGYALGAMAAAMTAKLTGVFEGSMPGPLLIVAFVMVGGLIGSRITGNSLEECRRAAIGGVIAAAMTAGIATTVTLAAASLVDM